MRRVLASLLVFVFAFFFLSVTSVSAKVISNEGDVTIGKGEIVNDDLIVGAQTVKIDGVVNGDVFIGAQTVKIAGVVNGNLHVGANTLELTGTVKGNVYAGAQNVLVNGSVVGGSLLTGAATVSIDKDSSVGGSVFAGAGALSMDSSVKRSVYAGAGSLTIGDSARIGKDLYYASGRDQGGVTISEKAKIAGNTYKSEFDTGKKDIEKAKKELPSIFKKIGAFTNIMSFLSALIVGALYFKLFGKHSSSSAELVSKSPWKSLGIGFLVTVGMVPALIILLITVIGIPLAGLGLMILLIYMYLTKIIVGVSLGEWLVKRFSWKISAYGAFALGLLVIYIFRMIPFIGPVVGLLVLWIGLGAFTLKIFSKTD